MIKKLLIISVVILAFQTVSAGDRPERWYQNDWCRQNNGVAEYRLPDRTRCDCLTGTHAIEFDFAPKWAEAIGQALHYGMQTGRTPGIVLIMTDRSENKYWIRLNSIINHYKLPIDTYNIGGP